MAANIFNKERYAKALYKYYLEKFGERQTDLWFEQPAVNVWVFGRDSKIITLKSHIITGKVTEQIENRTVVG